MVHEQVPRKKRIRRGVRLDVGKDGDQEEGHAAVLVGADVDVHSALVVSSRPHKAKRKPFRAR